MFEDNLISMREMHGYSQEELAEKIGVSRQTLSKYETGESLPDIEKCRLLANALDGSKVLADCGYDSNQLMDYIYDHGGEPTIPSRRGAKFDRRCDWWLYKERHLVENYFLKLKAFRRIATRYDKLAFTYLGFLCIVSILIWLK